MRREDVNPYISTLLSLVPSGGQARELLIELGAATDSMPELVADWVHLNELGLVCALRLKTWLGLDYQTLSLILGISPRELARLLRTQRLKEIGPYALSAEDEGRKLAGVSCFMVEQQLSSWIDSEWEDRSGLKSLREHLELCEDCGQRLRSYRQLEAKIIEERQHFEPISVEEWDQVLGALSRLRRKRRFQVLAVLFILVSLAALIAWLVTSQPKETPNIYEIEEVE